MRKFAASFLLATALIGAGPGTSWATIRHDLLPAIGHGVDLPLDQRMQLAKAKAWHLAMRNPRGMASTSPSIACPQSSGGLSLISSSLRLTGISPLLVFVNSTGTTDSNTLAGANDPFQDVYYAVNFGDTAASGTGTWRFGSNPNGNSRNLASGAMTAHEYVIADGAGDQTYTINIGASDGINSTACTLTVTVYDPIGANGFTAGNTTCFSAAGTFTNCPVGATHTTVGTFAATNGSQSNKRLLYHCGETFTGDNETVSGTKWFIGAYGTCMGTQTSRPIFSDTSAGNYELVIANTSVDGRVSDIDFEGNGSPLGAIQMPMNVLSTTVVATQITLNNLKMNGSGNAMLSQESAQWGLIDSEGFAKASSGNIGMLLNSSANNCVNLSMQPYCGLGVGNGVYIVADYNAFLGNNCQGVGGAGNNVESCRMSGGQNWVVSNNTFDNAIGFAANFKFQSGNTFNSCVPWLGKPTEWGEISDNDFGHTASGYEVASENGVLDERLIHLIVERNITTMPTNSSGTRQGSFSAKNSTYRDNVNVLNTASTNYPQTGTQFGARGPCMLTGNCSNVQSGCPTSESIAGFTFSGIEVYNNTVYSPTGHAGTNAFESDAVGGWAPATASFFKNNLLYVGTGSGYTVIVDTGSNTISNNTANANAVNNPGFTNGSGSFNVITDFKPSANFSGGTPVPVPYDAGGVPWSPTWGLGAWHN